MATKLDSKRRALTELYLLSTTGNRSGNPYSKAEVRNAIRLLGDPSGFDMPANRPRDNIGRAMYDLVVWFTRGDRSGNPHAKAVVKNANRALGGDGFDLPSPKKPAKRTAARNGRAKYGFYVVDKITGLVHAGNEFREDAVDERKAMIEDGVPASRVAVMTAASVRSKFGAIKWGTGRPDVRAAARNGTEPTIESLRALPLSHSDGWNERETAVFKSYNGETLYVKRIKRDDFEAHQVGRNDHARFGTAAEILADILGFMDTGSLKRGTRKWF